MKLNSLVLALALVCGASSAMACNPERLQFIGTVKNVMGTAGDIPVCTYQVDIAESWIDGHCPLDPEKAQDLVFTDVDCKKIEGHPISGVINKDDTSAWIE